MQSSRGGFGWNCERSLVGRGQRYGRMRTHSVCGQALG